MKVEDFGDAKYPYNFAETIRLVCEWSVDGIALQLYELTWPGFTSLDLIVRSDGYPPLRIALNNGTREVLANANQRDPKLLSLIQQHNQDVEKMLDQHTAVEKRELSLVAPQTSATRPLRL